MAATSDSISTAPYPAAMLIATLSLLVILLIIPPMCWHYRNRNIGATLLVAWAIIINLQVFINALLWPNDDMAAWYNGAVLCDIEVKIQIAFAVAAPASLASVMRALANAMDTSRATLVKSKAQRIRDTVIDISFCVGFPALQMLFHWIVQPSRYYLYGIAGCISVVSQTWVTVLLLDIPPLIWTLVDGYFAILILVRLLRYRQAFASVLASSDLTKTRFLRLYIFCIVSVLLFIPTQVYVLYTNLAQDHTSFSWKEIHNPALWNDIVMMPSHGHVVYELWLWICGAIVIFFFFGVGKDAMAMYRSAMLSMGMAKVFPSLSTNNTSRGSFTGTISSFSSKAKLYLKRKSSTVTWRTVSDSSRTASFADPVSPKNMTFLDAISEGQGPKEDMSWASTSNADDLEKGTPPPSRPRALDSIRNVFRSKKPTTTRDLSLTDMSGQPSTVRASVANGQTSPVVSAHDHTNSMEVIVTKEFRQASETIEPLASGVIEGRH